MPGYGISPVRAWIIHTASPIPQQSTPAPTSVQAKRELWPETRAATSKATPAPAAEMVYRNSRMARSSTAIPRLRVTPKPTAITAVISAMARTAERFSDSGSGWTIGKLLCPKIGRFGPGVEEPIDPVLPIWRLGLGLSRRRCAPGGG